MTILDGNTAYLGTAIMILGGSGLVCSLFGFKGHDAPMIWFVASAFGVIAGILLERSF